MEEIVSSAVVQETISQVMSALVQKYEERAESEASRNLERLEMAHIKLEAALETSEIGRKITIASGKIGCVLFFSQKTLLNTFQLVFSLHPWPAGGDTAAGAGGQRESNLTAHMVVSAVVQETVSRVPVTSYLLRQRQERRYGGKCFFS